MALNEYRRKRNFNKTPEPSGSKIKSTKNYRYLIQKHAASHLHYDFRLELNGVLKSWAVPKGPSLDPKIKRLAMHVEDHPIEYGSFQGTIPKGQYGGGTVMLWDKGTWLPQDENPYAAYQAGNMKFILRGKKLKGLWKLIRTGTENSWLLIKTQDEYAQDQAEYDVTLKEPNSVMTKQTMEQIANNSKKVWHSNRADEDTQNIKLAKKAKTKKTSSVSKNKVVKSVKKKR